MLCTALAHERRHPALAVLILVPLNHILFSLTTGLGASRASRPRNHGQGAESTASTQEVNYRPGHRAAGVVGLYLIASGILVWWYGSFSTLVTDLRRFSQTGEGWAIISILVVLTLLYRPLIDALRHVVGITGLKDARLWSALFLAVAVWVWCDGVFAGIYQQLALLCAGSTGPLCPDERVFSQPLSRFADAAYFSTVTLSTAGYGDIVPVSDVARGLVSVEIILGFGLLGFLLSRVAGFALPSEAPPKVPAADPLPLEPGQTPRTDEAGSALEPTGQKNHTTPSRRSGH